MSDTIGFKMDPATGSIWLVKQRPGRMVKKMRDVTAEIAFCWCAEISRAYDEDNEVRSIERSIRFSDGMECRINVHLTKLPKPAE